VDLLLVAYDGLQFYRMFHCAPGASADGRLDEAMLQNSLARLSQKMPAIAARAAVASSPVR
jgi:beta-N-acetylhexosaminidase